MSAKSHKGGSHHEIAAEHHETAARHQAKRPSTTRRAITRKLAITPMSRTRMDCMRPITGMRRRNTTLSTISKHFRRHALRQIARPRSINGARLSASTKPW